MITLIYFGNWYYDHASSYMPVMVRENGAREYHDRLLREGHTVLIRPATDDEHDQLLIQFDELVDELAAKGFVSGVGNFDPAAPPVDIEAAVAGLKARARIEPRRRS